MVGKPEADPLPGKAEGRLEVIGRRAAQPVSRVSANSAAGNANLLGGVFTGTVMGQFLVGPLTAHRRKPTNAT